MKKSVIIAIDGPSGSGKSTISTAVARMLGFNYINSGSLYRAIALKAINSHIAIEDEKSISKTALNTIFEIKRVGNGWVLFMDNKDISLAIKAPEIAQASSQVSTLSGIRDIINKLIKGMIKGNTVVEGRDIGTVVFPDAALKFFLTASVEERAKRRYQELLSSRLGRPYEIIRKEIDDRDMRDTSRDIAPLIPARDAIIVNTDNMSEHDVVIKLYEKVKATLSLKFIDNVNGIELYTTASAGFCFGVKRAIDIAVKTVKQEKEIYTLGPLIHNPQEVKRLEDMGIKPVNDIDTMTHGTLIYRSHGVTTEEHQIAKEKSLKTINATCPFVTRSQRLVKSLTNSGYYVVIVGDANHPEVKSLLSYASGGQVTAVKNAHEISTIGKVKKLAVLAQTTQSMENFKNVISALVDDVYELVIYNTICDATRIRQDEAALLAMAVDVVIVVGGFNSSNTNKLANICKAINLKTYHIEHPVHIKEEMLIDAKKIGITAGASTPIWLIRDVLIRLKKMSRKLSKTYI